MLCFRENKDEGKRSCKFREINQGRFLRKWTRDSRRRESDRGKSGVTGWLCLWWEEQRWAAGCGKPGPRRGKGSDASEPLRRDVVAWSLEGQVCWKAAGHWVLSEGSANMTHQQTGKGVWNNTTTHGSVAQAEAHTGAGERWGVVMRQAKRWTPRRWWISSLTRDGPLPSFEDKSELNLQWSATSSTAICFN